MNKHTNPVLVLLFCILLVAASLVFCWQEYVQEQKNLKAEIHKFMHSKKECLKIISFSRLKTRFIDTGSSKKIGYNLCVTWKDWNGMLRVSHLYRKKGNIEEVMTINITRLLRSKK